MQIISGKPATSFGAHLLIHSFHTCLWASPVAPLVKDWPTVQESQVQSLGWEDPLEKGNGNPLQYSLPGKSHGQRILVGYSPWDRKESDMTEQLHFTLDWVVRKGLFELTAGLRSKCQGASHAGMREEK